MNERQIGQIINARAFTDARSTANNNVRDGDIAGGHVEGPFGERGHQYQPAAWGSI